MSLSTDPHPLVHYWALVALSSVINAASLSYSPFVSSTLGMLFSAYSSSTHEDGGGSGLNANLLSVLPTHQVICQTIDGVISVTGPELMESNRTRALIIDLVHELGLESDDGIKVEAIKCIQHYLLFTSDHVDMQDLVNQLRRHLGSSCRPLKLASINALYQLVQKDALAMSKMGGDQLVEDLFRMLDEDAAVDGVRNIILSWLQQTASLNPSAWIDLCQRIMSRTTASQNVVVAATKTTALHDDEGESLGIGLTDGKQSNNSTSRWRTQLFSLQCLHTICDIVGRSGRREHLDLVFARAQKIPTAHLLISRVPDLIKMAFTASAAYVTEIRLEGLVVLRDIIEVT
jgi:HEAT repeat-containing protein 5